MARRLPLGNLLNRLFGCVVGADPAAPIIGPLDGAGSTPTRPAPSPISRTFFNLILAAAVPAGARSHTPWLLRKLLPARVAADDPSQPRHLDHGALETPPIALAAAAREALRMADALEAGSGLAPLTPWPAPTGAASARSAGWTMCSTG